MVKMAKHAKSRQNYACLPKSFGRMFVLVMMAVFGVGTVLFAGTIGHQMDHFIGEETWDGSALIIEYDQYARLGSSLINGDLTLGLEVSPALDRMQNPYDPDARTQLLVEEGEKYYFDHAFYRGDYYCYFGVAPALLLYIPYQLITGNWLPTPIAVIVLCCLFAVFIPVLVVLIFRRFSPAAPFWTVPIACVCLFLSSNVLLLAFSRPSIQCRQPNPCYLLK